MVFYHFRLACFVIITIVIMAYLWRNTD